MDSCSSGRCRCTPGYLVRTPRGTGTPRFVVCVMNSLPFFGKNIRKILRCYAFDQNTKTVSAKLKFLPGPESDQ